MQILSDPHKGIFKTLTLTLTLLIQLRSQSSQNMICIFHIIRCMMGNDKKISPSDFWFSTPHKMAWSSPTCRWYLMIISKQSRLRFSIPISSTATRKLWSLNMCSPISKSLWNASFNRSLRQPVLAKWEKKHLTITYIICDLVQIKDYLVQSDPNFVTYSKLAQTFVAACQHHLYFIQFIP